MRRRTRRNPSVMGQAIFTVATAVASSLLTLYVVTLLRPKTERAPGLLPQPIAPGQGSA